MRTKIDKRTSAPFPLRKRSRKREQAVTFWENKSLFDDRNIGVIFGGTCTIACAGNYRRPLKSEIDQKFVLRKSQPILAPFSNQRNKQDDIQFKKPSLFLNYSSTTPCPKKSQNVFCSFYCSWRHLRLLWFRNISRKCWWTLCLGISRAMPSLLGT